MRRPDQDTGKTTGSRRGQICEGSDSSLQRPSSLRLVEARPKVWLLPLQPYEDRIKLLGLADKGRQCLEKIIEAQALLQHDSDALKVRRHDHSPDHQPLHTGLVQP